MIEHQAEAVQHDPSYCLY